MRHLTPHQLQQWLADATRENPLLLDVREVWETAICSLPQCLHIPMLSVTERQDELPRERSIVVICHHGARSMQVASFLDRNGFVDIYNLSGGLAAWAEEIDPSMDTY